MFSGQRLYKTLFVLDFWFFGCKWILMSHKMSYVSSHCFLLAFAWFFNVSGRIFVWEMGTVLQSIDELALNLHWYYKMSIKMKISMLYMRCICIAIDSCLVILLETFKSNRGQVIILYCHQLWVVLMVFCLSLMTLFLTLSWPGCV